MARGFESKSVADQQEEPFRDPPAVREREDPDVQRQRGRLDLARIDVLARLRTARSEPHRRLLEQSLAALEQQLADLGERGA